MTREARHVAEDVARRSLGRLVALVARRTRDIAAAEDALSDAFAAALRRWPRDGVPDRPEAWLLTTARRVHGRVERATATHRRYAGDVLSIGFDAGADTTPVVPDERLRLMFACAHPAIDPSARAPLMLQTVLGMDAGRVAQPFLVAPTTMGQRLVRAKAKIRDAGIRFEIPEPSEFPDRLNDVLTAIYAAFCAGWDVPDQDGSGQLAEEALYLARLVVDLSPRAPEAMGLLALMLHCAARNGARLGPDGAYVPLSDQDTNLWSLPMIREAETLLAAAASRGEFGRFQCEAAIQSVHAHRARTRRTDWAAIVHLYDLLTTRAPSVGAWIGRAAALCQSGQVDEALLQLDTIWNRSVDGYQPYWATRAEVLARLGRRAEAKNALATAIALSRDRSVVAFLEKRLGEIA
jgi:RNA polymerase sigma-70 factor (ECF subfamily)